LSKAALTDIYRKIVQAEKREQPMHHSVDSSALAYKDDDLQIAMEIFVELGILEIQEGVCKIIPTKEKKQLYASRKYCDYLGA